MLAAEISRKSLRLKYSEAQKAANVTLLSNDVNAATWLVPTVHHFWAYPLEIGINMYNLTTIVHQASFLVVFPTIGMSCLPSGNLQLTMYHLDKSHKSILTSNFSFRDNRFLHWCQVA